VDEVAGQGRGFVSQFDLDGNFIRRGDGVPVTDEELARREVVIQETEHLVRTLSSPYRIRIVRCQPADLEPETQSAHGRNHVGLLVDKPAYDLSQLERVLGKQRRAGGEIEENCVRLRQVAVLRLEHRRGAGRIDPREVVGQGFAVEDVDADALVRQAELGEDEPGLVAVAGGCIVIQT
jgi:hypothetical protein